MSLEVRGASRMHDQTCFADRNRLGDRNLLGHCEHLFLKKPALSFSPGWHFVKLA
jgi:hypothetical protein